MGPQKMAVSQQKWGYLKKGECISKKEVCLRKSECALNKWHGKRILYN